MLEQNPPRIRVRLRLVSRDRGVPTWIRNVEHEIHRFSLSIIDDGTRDSALEDISLVTVDSAIRNFIASTYIGDDFDLVFTPIEQEDEEPKPIIKQTDLAETILNWTRLKREEMSEMAAGSIAKLLSVFLIDIENLCEEYLKDGQP